MTAFLWKMEGGQSHGGIPSGGIPRGDKGGIPSLGGVLPMGSYSWVGL